MMRSLRFKWITTLLLTSLVGVFLVGVVASQTALFAYDRLRIEKAQDAFVDDMTIYYEQYGGWNGLQKWLITRESLPEEKDELFPPKFFALADTQSVVVAGFGPLKTGEIASPDMIAKGIPLLIKGNQVGTAMLAQAPQDFDPREQSYIDSVNRALMIGTLGASGVALLIGILLSQHFLRPLKELTHAITAMQQGNLEQQVQVRTNDELGMLAQAFNRMSMELNRANRLRKQMTADIAHDLRTPLMVISGYLEAMRDGTLQPTIERFDAMNQETLLLKRLIEDLRTLSLADAGELKLVKQVLSPREFLEQIKESFAPLAREHQITLHLKCPADVPLVQIDRERMAQVMGNLLSNALRYTRSGGDIILQAQAAQKGMQFVIRDTGVGISQEKLPNIFERFYRADESRYQHEGESGLGLAIAKAIVEAHQGTITVESEVGVGTTVTITLQALPSKRPDPIALLPMPEPL
jgi:two-component system, OmpR family, sensor histidine kinase BaeS